jgi:hypothetical protein
VVFGLAGNLEFPFVQRMAGTLSVGAEELDMVMVRVVEDSKAFEAQESVVEDI